jgi:3-hydroxyisobutyrate dehydrogenase-like beta-hydroxyacid dehydrogenase
MDGDALLLKLRTKTAKVGIIGLGYVGLPLARAFSRAGLPVLGFDIDPRKISALSQGQSYIQQIPHADVQAMRERGFEATDRYDRLGEADAVLICVPTPLTDAREPDLQYVVNSAYAIAGALRPGQLVVLESTTYPTTTRNVVLPILEKTGLIAGQDYFLAFSPEREDPGNATHSVDSIPKVVGGLCERSREAACQLYTAIVPKVVPVSTPEVAEACKILENTYRAINIALVNELKVLYDRMGIDVWEVIDAAKTKPFGFQAFYPGPGLGGHCIPIDPFYLTWVARQYGCSTRFIARLRGGQSSGCPQRSRPPREGQPHRHSGHGLQERRGRSAGIPRLRTHGSAAEEGCHRDLSRSAHCKVTEHAALPALEDGKPSPDGELFREAGLRAGGHGSYGLRLRVHRSPCRADRRYPQRAEAHSLAREDRTGVICTPVFIKMLKSYTRLLARRAR